VNSNGPGFGLWVALPSGGALVELPSATIPTARIQAIHNSADAAAAEVDVYLNGALLVDDFAFRTATPFVNVQAGVDLTLSIAPGTSTSVADAIANFDYNLPAGETFILVANGIVSGSGYSPATPFDIYVYPSARETAQGTGTDVLVFHGCTDAPTVDVFESAVVNTTIVNDISYGEFDGYLELPTLDFTLQVRTADGATTVASYAAPLQTLGLQGAALTVLASGFLNPAVNSNGPAFGLWVALANGGALVELPIATSVSEQGAIASAMAWPNPANDRLTLDVDALRDANLEVDLIDATGRTARLMSSMALNSGRSQLNLDLSGMANGSYTLALRSNGGALNLPVVIAR
jgi:hypothetical protein